MKPHTPQLYNREIFLVRGWGGSGVTINPKPSTLNPINYQDRVTLGLSVEAVCTRCGWQFRLRRFRISVYAHNNTKEENTDETGCLRFLLRM